MNASQREELGDGHLREGTAKAAFTLVRFICLFARRECQRVLRLPWDRGEGLLRGLRGRAEFAPSDITGSADNDDASGK